MRGKIAKALRRAARREMAGHPERIIQTVNQHHKRYPQLVRHVHDGNGGYRLTDDGIRTVAQHVNHPMTMRGRYLQMKKEYARA